MRSFCRIPSNNSCITIRVCASKAPNGSSISKMRGSFAAMAAALGLSLTHRDCAKSVRFITGHSKKGGLPDDIDWAAVADVTTTTIFYMGGRTAAAIAERLIAHGLSPQTPVAIATAISRPEQRIAHAILADLPSAIGAIDSTMPVVIGVGQVFANAESAQQRSGATAA